MIDLEGNIETQDHANKHDALVKIYKMSAFILIPIFSMYLLAEFILPFEISLFQKSQLIYVLFMLIVALVISKVELIKEQYHLFHYCFLFGVILIGLVWFYYEPKHAHAAIVILSANIIGVVLLNPKITVWFYSIVFVTFLGLQFLLEQAYPEISLVFAVSAVVISIFNFWRFNLNKALNTNRKNFVRFFNASIDQIFVLSENLVVLDLNKSAKNYLKQNQTEVEKGTKFNQLLIPATANCMNKMDQAIQECRKTGFSRFQANCSAGNSQQIHPKEITLTKSKYFDQEVYLTTVRLIDEQKKYENELLRNKENVIQVLENISSFVFNITFDEQERFKHKVEFVSSKVEEVYGYSIDEYISLVKAEKISKDRHPEDAERINTEFEKLLKTGGSGEWQFRMKVRGAWRWIEEKISIADNQNGTKTLFGIVKDVTSEIEREHALVESQKRYKQLFELNLAGVYKTHVDGTILECNESFAKMLGYDRVEDVVNLNTNEIYYHDGHRDAYVKELKEQKYLSNYLTIIKRKDGRRLILNNNVSIVPDENGEENWIVGTLVDVTELHETGLALTQSEEKYRLLFDSSNSAILLLLLDDDASFIMDANKKAEELFLLSETDLIGKKLIQISDQSYHEVIAEIRELVENNERFDGEWIFTKKDGNTFHAEVSFAPINLNEQQVVQLIIKDISSRKAYENELVESRLSFKNIVDNSPSSIFIFTEERLVYLNTNAEKIYFDLFKTSSRNLFNVFPAEHEYLIKDLLKEADSEINSYTEIVLGENGQSFNINVVRIVYNNKPSYLFILDDTSLQKEYNEQKLRAEIAEETNKQLQAEIESHELTQKHLKESNSRLQALLESTANLYMLSLDHDLKVVDFNKHFVNMVQEKLDKEVNVGDDFLEIFPMEDYGRTAITKKLEDVLKGKTLELISHFPTNKGELWLETFMNPIIMDDDNVHEISFIAHDITERVNNREKLLISERDNQAILVAIPDILFKINEEGEFTDFRPSSEMSEASYKRLFKDVDVIGKNISDVLHDEKVAAEIIRCASQCLSNNELITHNFSLNTPDQHFKIHFENRYSKLNENEVVVISRNVTDTVEYEKKLLESVKEKEVLLKEVHHRVKNNLQVINSILNLQSSYVKDEETLQIIIESQNRIRSMSFIHESLYQTKDFTHISFDTYISTLIKNLVQSYEVRANLIKLNLEIDKVDLALDQAIPCGLILNELISNALKYAYPLGEEGEITIKVTTQDSEVQISVRDFGVGLPEGLNIAESDSLGLSLVDTLVSQLEGECVVKREGGTEFLIIFAKQE